jgi:chromosome segregation ATPase
MEFDPESTDIPNLQNQVTFLLHKLKVRQQIIASLQQRTHTPQGLQLQEVVAQMEDLRCEYDRIKEDFSKLQSENDILQQKSISAHNSSVQDLQDTILDLSDELTSLTKTLNFKDEEITELKQKLVHSLSLKDEEITQLKQKHEKIIALRDEEISKLERKLQDYETRLETFHKENLASQGNQSSAYEESQMWKKRYFKEAQASLQLQQSMNSLAEENSCHVECIALLEKRIAKLEYEIFELNNQQFKEIHEQRLANAKVALSQAKRNTALKEKLDLQVLKTELDCERAVSKDLREQLHACIDSKEELQHSLSISRHHLLQATMRFEEAASRVKVLEDMRLSDIEYINRLENGC